MRFQILHESPGRMRLRADVESMSLTQADLLEAWIMACEGVESITVHERTFGVIILYHCERSSLCRALAAFSYKRAERELQPVVHSSRPMNREYKEKLVFMVARHYLKRLLFPTLLRCVIDTCVPFPRIIKCVKTACRRKLTVDVLDGIAIGTSLLTGDFSTAGSVNFLLGIGELLEEWTHKKSVDDLARSMSLQVDQVWKIDTDGTKKWFLWVKSFPETGLSSIWEMSFRLTGS